MLWAVSRAPLERLQAYKRRMGWGFPWASSHDSDFNFDFNVSFTEEQQRSGPPNTTSAKPRLNRLLRRPQTGRSRRGRPPRAPTGPRTHGNGPG